jgi:Type II secretion system (T2SS), protein E, N-terminal domain
LSETGSPVLTPELVLVSPELLAEAQQRQTKRKAAMSSSEPANGTFFVDPAQPAPPPASQEIAPPPAPSPEPVAAPAAAAPAAAPSGSAPTAPMIDVPLGTLIFRAGLLAEEQLEDALQEGMRTGKRLGEVLIERGWLHERDLGRLLAGQKGLPFVEISASDAEPAALQQLPQEKAKLQVALPLRHEDGQLVVAVADPSNELMLENLRRALGAEPRLVVAPYADLVRSIGEAYGSVPAEAPALPEPVVPEPAAQPLVRASGPGEGVPGEPGGSPVADVAQPQPEIAQPDVQFEPQPEAQLAPPTAPEPAAVEPIQPLTPPAVTPLPTVLPPAEERAPEPVPSPLVPPPPAEPAPPPTAVEETHAVEAPVVPAIEMVPPLHEQAASAPEPVAPPPAVAPAEPEVPAVQPPPAQEPVVQPPVAPPPAAEVLAAPEVPASPPLPVESPVPQAPVQEDEQGAVSVVVLRLRDGDALEIGTFPTAAEAATRAQEVVAEIAAAEVNRTWPFFAKRYLRPDSILSVDLVEEDADKWLGSSVRRSWAGQQ